MIVRKIYISREGDYGYGNVDASKPFRAQITVQGASGQIELNLSPDMSQRIMSIVAEEVAAAGRATAEAMVAEVFTVPAIAAPEAVQ